MIMTLPLSCEWDAFVNGRHGDFLGNNDVLTWNGTHDEWDRRKANCRPRDFMTNATLPKETPCSAECIEGATYMGNYAKATSSLSGTNLRGA